MVETLSAFEEWLGLEYMMTSDVFKDGARAGWDAAMNRVSKLEFSDNDILLVKAKECLSDDAIAGLKEALRQVIPEKVQIVILEGGIELRVIKNNP